MKKKIKPFLIYLMQYLFGHTIFRLQVYEVLTMLQVDVK